MRIRAMLMMFGWATVSWAGADSAEQIVLHKVIDRLLPSNALNVVTYEAPRAIALRALNLDGVGLTPGPAIMKADEIRIFTNRSVMGASPKARIWLNAREGGRWWYQTGGVGSAEDHVIQPGEAVVIITHATTTERPWKNPLVE